MNYDYKAADLTLRCPWCNRTAMDESQLQLARFYGADTKDALIEAQAKHIEKLQAKLPALRDEQPGRVREG